MRYTKSFDVEKSKKIEKICKVHIYVLYCVPGTSQSAL